MLSGLRLVDLKNKPRLLSQYVELRNRHCQVLLTEPVNLKDTRAWLKNNDVELFAVTGGGSLLGAGILYCQRKAEIAFFVKVPGKGIGSFLLAALEKKAAERGFRRVWAWVLAGNQAAQKAFLKNGYSLSKKNTRIYRKKKMKGMVFEKAVGAHPVHTQAHYGLREQAREFPMMCVLALVYVCNARCRNCPYTNSKIRQDYSDSPFMKEETFRIIADQCGKYGAWIRISGGGEPMLHPRIVEMVEYAKKAGAKVGLITNGSLFDSEKTRRLLESGVDMIEFSVDASNEKEYALVRAGLDWRNLVSNVRRAVRMRNRLKSNTKIIASAVKQKAVDIIAARAFWSPIVDDFQERKYLTWSITDPSCSADKAPYLPPEKRIPCPFVFERLNIDSRGRVMVCGFDIAGRTDMGNIHEKSISEIWHSKGFRYYRRMHLARKGNAIPMCRRCPDWKYRSWQHNYWKLVKNAALNLERKRCA